MNKKSLSREEVEKIATLCALKLSNDELVYFGRQLEDTLDYIESLNEINTENVKVTSQVTGLTNVFREDVEGSETLSHELAMKNASSKKDGLFVTKAVFDR